ncbi:MAG: carbohydrate kinase [Desulfobulbaceae bacterium]|uniref:Carbohydrate kinase n=1 Tax=Candidatus Desulfatifera sulfidica TaxID=2841691 RepID=A0A8J6TD31_9BACT|nr:carbohydrate kinase [Candidatus Desulfatifera sulfidica]
MAGVESAKTSRPVIFGEVLFDCFSDGSEVLGGAPFNVAWHLQAFGLAPLLVSRVGQDAYGARVRQAMADWGMDLSGLQEDQQTPTGRVDIRLDRGEPDFSILDHQAYDMIAPPEQLPVRVAFIYHGSLALRGSMNRATLRQMKNECGAPVFVDVNLRPPWWEAEVVNELLSGSTWVKLNEDELTALVPDPNELELQAAALLASWPLELLCVTRGRHGALLFQRDNSSFSTTPVEDVVVVDTVGAGDAFSAILLLGLYWRWPMALTLQRAQDFALAVVGRRGATTTDFQLYEPFLRDWHKQ